MYEDVSKVYVLKNASKVCLDIKKKVRKIEQIVKKKSQKKIVSDEKRQ